MRLNAAGVSTHYQRIGQGPRVVLLHGWGCDWQIWSPVITTLSEDFQLLIPDLPAFGQSDEPATTWNSRDYATWLADFIAQTSDDQPVAVVGHSFGGKIAALAAADQTSTQPAISNLTQLVLVDASGLPDPVSIPRQLQKTALGLIPPAIKNAIPYRLKLQLLAKTGNSTDFALSSPAQRRVFQEIYQENIGAQLKNITIPTLLLWGKNDLDTPLHQGQHFAQLIPQSQLVVFDRSGHFPFVDQPTEFVASLQQFINHA